MIDHWWKLCLTPHFNSYQFKEQDLLNIIFHYGNYKTICFDWSNEWHGLVSKGFWNFCELKNGELVLPKGDRPWPQDADKTIKVLHWAGGNDPDKMNYKIRFKEEVVKWLDQLVK